MFLTLLQSGGAGPGVITGNLAATESGADTAALVGVVLVQGSVAAQEAGSDTLSCEGGVRVQGDLAAQETGADTFAATGTVGSVITGTLAATESGADTLAATGNVIVQGALAATEAGADTFAATGTVTSPSAVQGNLAATEAGSDTFSGSGTSGKPFGPPDWEYRPNTGGGPIGSMGPFTVQRKRRRPLPVDQQQEDAQEAAADPWSQQFREIALADDAEISEFVFCLVSSGVLDGHV